MLRSGMLQLRVSDDERSLFKRAAYLCGVNCSVWVRGVLRREAGLLLTRAGLPVVFMGDVEDGGDVLGGGHG